MKIQLPSSLPIYRLSRPRIYSALSGLLLILATGNSFAVNGLVYSNCSNYSTNGGFPISDFSSYSVAQDCAAMGTGTLGNGVERKIELIKVFSRTTIGDFENVIYDVRQTFTENGTSQISEGTFISTYKRLCPIGFELANSTDQCIQVTCDNGEAWNSDKEQCEPSPKHESCPKSDEPISFLTGYKYKQQTDIPTSIHSLGFQRYYRSGAVYGLDTVLGGYWRHQYEQKIKVHPDDLELVVVTANGRQIPFHQSGNVWIGDTDSTSTLTELFDTASNRTGWQHHTNNNQIELYNAKGQITSITYLNGDQLTFDYALDEQFGGDVSTLTLDKVSDASGHSIQFSYTEFLLTSVMDQDGLTYAYEYNGADHLNKVIYPDETPLDNTDNPSIIYHYEDTNFPAAVTGITDEQGERSATWVYDKSGACCFI